MNTASAPFKALHVGTQNTNQRSQMWHTTGINVRLTFSSLWCVKFVSSVCPCYFAVVGSTSIDGPTNTRAREAIQVAATTSGWACE